MAEEHLCGFCGKSAEHVVEAPGGAYICWDCLVVARDVVAQMQTTYTCSFCGEAVPGQQIVEGTPGLYMCASCIESGIKLLQR